MTSRRLTRGRITFRKSAVYTFGDAAFEVPGFYADGDSGPLAKIELLGCPSSFRGAVTIAESEVRSGSRLTSRSRSLTCVIRSLQVHQQ